MRAYLIALALLVTVPANAADCGADPKPAAWCSWWLRRHLHIPCDAFPPYQWNLARAWEKLGAPAWSGCTGCIAVFTRGRNSRSGHVGLVESWEGRNPVVKSGNVAGGVATRAYPIERLTALRWVR